MATAIPAIVRTPHVYHFGRFDLDVQTGELRIANRRIRLQPQPVELLTLLVMRAGELVTREEIQQHIWGYETFVDFEHGLNFCVQQIRLALGDNALHPKYVETLPRRGYRFIAEVRNSSGENQASELGSSLDVVPPLIRRKWKKNKGLSCDLAVLPFKIIGQENDAENLDFAEMLTDALIGGLAQKRSFGITSRTSVLQYRNSNKLLSEIARELEVDLIVEGTMLKLSQNFRISVSLLDARRDRHIWNGQYSRSGDDIIGLLSETANEIIKDIEVRVQRSPAPKNLAPKIARPLPSNKIGKPEAHDAYLRGCLCAKEWDENSLKLSVELLKQAVHEQPQHGPSHAALAMACATLGTYVSQPHKEIVPLAKGAVTEALRLTPSSPQSRVAKAVLSFLYERNWATAEREFHHAIKFQKDFAEAHQWYGVFLASANRGSEAIAELKLAHDLEPFSPYIVYQLGWVHLSLDENEQAIRFFRRALELKPGFAHAYSGLGLANINRAKFDEAIENLQQAVTRSNRQPYMLSTLGYAFGKLRELREASRLVNELGARVHRLDTSAIHVAAVYAGIEDADATIAWLEKAWEEAGAGMALLKTMPFFSSIQSQPAFRKFLQGASRPTVGARHIPS